jgi:hypothetical protein
MNKKKINVNEVKKRKSENKKTFNKISKYLYMKILSSSALFTVLKIFFHHHRRRLRHIQAQQPSTFFLSPQKFNLSFFPLFALLACLFIPKKKEMKKKKAT